MTPRRECGTRGARRRAVLLLAAALLAPGAAGALALTRAERAGKRLYLEGSVPGGRDVPALLGRGGAELTARAVPCGTCHGPDGLGRAEGATRPSSIVWSELARPHGHSHPDGRRHGPYDARSLGRAIRDGVDPSGAPLDPAMPRYDLDDAELASLVAYLRRLEDDVDPGVGSAELRIGALLPSRGPGAEIGATLRSTLEQELAALSRAGGIHGRRLRLVVERYDASGGRPAVVAAARRLLERGRVLALVSGFFPAAEEEVYALADGAGVPVVGPLTVWATQAESPSPWVFHLVAGVAEQARVLADFAAERLGPARPRVLVLHADEPRLAAAADAARDRLARRGFEDVEVHRFPAGRLARWLPGGLATPGAGAVLFLGRDADLVALLEPLSALPAAPLLLVPGLVAARGALEAPAPLRSRVFLAYPNAPGAAAPEVRARLAALELPAAHRSLATLASADAAVAVLAEGLRRTGRSVSRRGLQAALEGLWRFDAGLLPPLTYGPRRRVGALGAFVLGADGGGGFLPVGGWREVEEVR